MIPRAPLGLLHATDALAVIGVETPAHPLSCGEVPIEGELYGPRCSTAQTLCAAYPARRAPGSRIAAAGVAAAGVADAEVADAGVAAAGASGAGAWAAGAPPDGWEITIPDPCYWRPELPFLYDLTFYDKTFAARAGDSHAANFQAGRSRVVATSWLGLRGLHAHRRDLRCENRRCVFRGVATPQADLATQATARASDAALWTGHVDDRQLENAAREGTWIIVDLRNDAHDFRATLARLAWNPAVAIGVLSASQLAARRDSLPAKSPGPLARRLLLAQFVDSEVESTSGVSEEADLLVWELSANRRLPPDWLRDAALPIMALDRGTAYPDVASARRACDRLQADLAPASDLAGYFTELCS